jgi:4,5-dihydroxyphthalate decarboxylase
MAFTTYLCARAAGLPFTAIPVFVTRNFHHWAVFINTKSGIKGPKDLEGRKVGVNRGYTVTTGLWARGILHSEYGVDLSKVTWIPTDDEHVAGFAAPKNVDYRFRGAKMRDLLLSGEIDAAIGEVAVDVPEIQPLIPDAQNAAFGYFRKTGIYPINHGVVVKDSVLKEAPWIVDELCRAFEAAKAEYLKNLDMNLGAAATSWDKAAKVNADVVGDPYPFGIEPNRKTLEAMTRFAVDQGMVPRKYSVEELFVPPG